MGAVKKILMIAYYYPPVSGGGVQRTSKFAKYLPRFGFTPVVVTVKAPYDYYQDTTLTGDIVPGVKVIRTASLEPMKWIRKWLKWPSDKRTKRSGNRIVEQGTVKKAEWLLKLKESIFVPDAEIGWVPF